ncbi:GyrI-like domain-containing protein [uncultured Tenacibaculum sp.]|uniref:AraC family transcriptional regulator n=1 Tax=uncultured Tenacibaculum sp. TaxID=174713 RepID=UPI00261DE4ED|nr:AraC family transcriptional regulator [uncultured Tenacibaculum sp.]
MNKNNTQIERYQKLIVYLENKFKTDINSKDIEDVSFYSYRNINRIFAALQHETIGQFIKRKRLEKAAEFLKYSAEEISDIALDIGYKDVAAFSKAFKKHFNCSPSTYRNSQHIQQEITTKILQEKRENANKTLSFSIEHLPSFKILYLQYKGSYEDIRGIEKTWNSLLKYVFKKKLLSDETILLGEILDDDDITDTLQCRYNAGIVLEDHQDFDTKGFFEIKEIPTQKYAKFIHKRSHESCYETYNNIYARWMQDVQLEFADQATLEFYVNDESTTPKEELITEIYIPVV